MTPINSGLSDADVSPYLLRPLRSYAQAVRDQIEYHERMICRALDGHDTGLDLRWHQDERIRLTEELKHMGDENA